MKTSIQIRRCSLLLAVLMLPLNWSGAAELENIGTLSFPTSAGKEAQRHFILGVGYLHSFGWKQARDEFIKAQQIEPDFALAYWGETFTYNHPFIPEQDALSPREALKKLGATPEERLAKAPTTREKGFLRAAEAYAFTDGPVANKRTAWMNAMADLSRAFPEDREVAAFYAVSLLSGATASREVRERYNMRAGAIALELFRENENHPGAAHYIIHAFDDPIHAPIALPAADKYAKIAPAVSHARHMPTHIYIQHGMWREVSQGNESAFQAAKDLWMPGDSPGDMNHSSDWGQYGDLQLGDSDRSNMWIERAEKILSDNHDDPRSSSTLRRMKARAVIESEQWQTDKVTDDLSVDELLAVGLSAVKLGDLDRARRAQQKLATLAEEQPNNVSIKIIQLEISALLDVEANKVDTALDKIDSAIELTNQQPLPRGAVNPLKPAHELAGEIHLTLGNHKDAAELFEQSLLRTPNRTRSLLGLARSYARLDDREKAIDTYNKLLANWKKSDWKETTEARRYINIE